MKRPVRNGLDGLDGQLVHSHAVEVSLQEVVYVRIVELEALVMAQPTNHEHAMKSFVQHFPIGVHGVIAQPHVVAESVDKVALATMGILGNLVALGINMTKKLAMKCLVLHGMNGAIIHNVVFLVDMA